MRRYGNCWPLRIEGRRLLRLPYIPANAQGLYLSGVRKLQEIILDDEERCLQRLEIRDCKDLKHLGALPSIVLKLLVINCPELERIDAFSEFCAEISIINCPKLKELPPLPRRTTGVFIQNTGITVLPPRMGPDPEPTMSTFQYLNISQPSAFQIPFVWKIDMKPYIAEWETFHREKASKERIQKKAKVVKEEIVQKVFAPERIEKLIATHGIEIIEAL